MDGITSRLHSWHYSSLVVLSVLTHLLTQPRDSGFFWQFEVYNIQNWALDHGSELHHQEDGCGALTGWSWTDASSTSLAKVYFNLPFFMKAGCVERAIVSAGGPKISCQGGGIGLKSRRRQPTIHDDAANSPDDELRRREDKTLAEVALRRAVAEESEKKNKEKKRKRAATTEGPSRLSLTDTPTYTYPSTLTTPTYIPMTWDANNTVILTWTLTDTNVGQSTYTYTSTIPGYTYTSNSTTSSKSISTSSKPSSTPLL
jgi:chitinase